MKIRVKILVLLLSLIVIISNTPYSHGTHYTTSMGAPKWNVGDSWSYDGLANYTIAEDPSIGHVNLSTDNFIFKVENDEGSYYTISMSSKLHIYGYVNIEDLGIKTNLKLSNGKIYGTAKIDKNNLGMKSFEIGASGIVIASIAPVPIPLKGKINLSFDSPLYLLNFPLGANKTWTTPETNLSINIDKDMINFIENVVSVIERFLPPDMADIVDEFMNELLDMLPFKIYIPELNMKCLGLQNIVIPAGEYPAFLISIEDTVPLYFSLNAANYVKATYDGAAKARMEMISITYAPPGAPDKPAMPSGNRFVFRGKSYTYETVSSSPSGGKVQYGWDWNGDGIVDEWTDFYPSGQKVKVTHVWEERGKYVVRVKARDESGLESTWSDGLYVRTWFAGIPLLHYVIMKNIFDLR